jgi:hypothetical protein
LQKQTVNSITPTQKQELAMRIPAEALLPYPADSGRFAETPGTRPISGSANLTGQLPESLPRAQQTPTHKESSGHREHARGEGEPPRQERRHDDRRQKSVPVTLDTRLTRPRRRSTDPTIDTEV